ncbi:hypothetical protein [Maribacter halichondriae]|uniref:hypothetical protein n=1 Tax=Maribacter halichondriae TaxID=2980554 RepID=UPI0023594504|nr:hypothetical protein [Maribacter sp. Hal144]
MNKYIFFLFLIVFFFSCKKEPTTLFSKLDFTDTGISFKNELTETHTYNYFTYPYMYLGGGVSTGDINNDGLEDIFLPEIWCPINCI